MLERLACRGFRNLEDLDWEPGAGPQLLLGGNGAGKTGVLEAVYVLATTRSFRTSRLADCCRHGAEAFRVAGRVGGDARTDLEVGWSPQGRMRTVNGRASALTRHLEVLPVVAWSAADGELVGGGPVVRRRFLDQGVVGLRPGALETLTRYRRALEQKRELLTRGGGGLGPWNELLAGVAAELARLRAEYVERLSRTLETVASASGLELAPPELRYRPSPRAAVEGGREGILETMERLRRREVERRVALVGPHRDELEIRWGGHELKRVASAGERKLVGLLLAAARGRLLVDAGRPPVFLLDDLDSELDGRRLQAAWELFAAAPQALCSSNRPEVWRDLAPIKAWRLEAGRLTGQ